MLERRTEGDGRDWREEQEMEQSQTDLRQQQLHRRIRLLLPCPLETTYVADGFKKIIKKMSLAVSDAEVLTVTGQAENT